MAATSQGTTVSFSGSISQLLTVNVCASAGGTTDATGADAPVLGQGANARVLKQLDMTSVEPAKVSITHLGATPFTVDDIGRKSTLTVTGTGFGLSAQAYLSSFETTASVGDLLRSSAEFQLTGG